MLKVISSFRRRGSITHEAFAAYWKDVHGPMVARIPGLRRHVQSHAVAPPEDPYEPDVIDELWFDDAADLVRARASAEWRAAEEDEARCAGPGRETMEVVEHEVLIPSTTAGSPRLVVLGLIEN